MKVSLDRGSQNLKDKIQFMRPETIKIQTLGLKKLTVYYEQLNFVGHSKSWDELWEKILQCQVQKR